ncbi:DUF4240 domain-containing protein [Streptomyces griseorubiginosus]|uniref:DUF4240 domain-containing protein n=1 Tax=Streptomyces griseorubiginosus TaxID=67304 RepID=UPI003F53B475
MTHEAFTWDLWAAADRIFGGWCSDDGFCCFGLWMVGLGRDAFSGAVADPDSLTDTPEVQRLVGRPREMWNDEWLGGSLSTMSRWRRTGVLTGVEDDCGDASCAAVDAEQGGGEASSGPLGQRWDVRRENEAARKLPKSPSPPPKSPAAGPKHSRIPGSARPSSTG